MSAPGRIGRFLLLWAGAAACGDGRSPGGEPAEPEGPEGPARPEPPVVTFAEEPARPAADPWEVVPEFADETEGLDRAPWEGSGPTREEQEASGVLGGSFVLARPFPPRRANHRELLRGRGRATQTVVQASLAALRARALPDGGWAEEGIGARRGSRQRRHRERRRPRPRTHLARCARVPLGGGRLDGSQGAAGDARGVQVAHQRVDRARPT